MRQVNSASLEDARRVIAAGEEAASKIGQPMNIAVVDAGGNLIAHERMDGAWVGSIDISINKAFTARAFDIATKDLAGESQPNKQFFGIHASNHGRERNQHTEQGEVPVVQPPWVTEIQRSV